jgi:hypothetical protein
VIHSLIRSPTSTGRVVWPLVDPTGAEWVAEGAALPDVTLGDDTYVIATHKLAGILEVSNESIADTAYNLDEQVSNALVDAFSHQLDLGPLTGTGDVDNQPTGVVTVADESTGDSLWSAAAAAIGELGEAGGAANTVALGAAAAATEAARVGDDGHPVYPDGLATFQGLNVVRVPGLTTPLVYDAARVYLVEREDFSVEQSAHAAWRTDGLSRRVKSPLEHPVRVIPRPRRRPRPGPVHVHRRGLALGRPGPPAGAHRGVDQPPAHPRRVHIHGVQPLDEPDQYLRVDVGAIPAPPRGQRAGGCDQPGHGHPNRRHYPGRPVATRPDDQLPPHRIPHRRRGGPAQQHGLELGQVEDAVGQPVEAAPVEGQRRGRAAQQVECALRGRQRRRRPRPRCRRHAGI